MSSIENSKEVASIRGLQEFRQAFGEIGRLGGYDRLVEVCDAHCAKLVAAALEQERNRVSARLDTILADQLRLLKTVESLAARASDDELPDPDWDRS